MLVSARHSHFNLNLDCFVLVFDSWRMNSNWKSLHGFWDSNQFGNTEKNVYFLVLRKRSQSINCIILYMSNAVPLKRNNYDNLISSCENFRVKTFKSRMAFKFGMEQRWYQIEIFCVSRLSFFKWECQFYLQRIDFNLRFTGKKGKKNLEK